MMTIMHLNRYYRLLIMVFLSFVTSHLLFAGPLGSLDTSSRKAVREAEMSGYGSFIQDSSGSASQLDTASRRLIQESDMGRFSGGKNAVVGETSSVSNPGVLIQNSIDAQGHKKCIISAGKVINGEVKRGSATESRTIVTGNIVNVCQ